MPHSLTSDPGTVLDTVVLTNHTVVPGNFPAISAPNPTAAVYDSADGYLFLLSNSNVVVVWNPATGQFVRSIPFYGSHPDITALLTPDKMV